MKNRLLLLLAVLLVATGVALADGEGEAAVVPWVLLVPYFIGVFLHWLKKYTLDKVTVSFWGWFATSIIATISTLLAGLAAVFSMYTAHPEAYNIADPMTWLQVITVAVAADTINGSMTAKKEG